jgi:hypothetical protein
MIGAPVLAFALVAVFLRRKAIRSEHPRLVVAMADALSQPSDSELLAGEHS